MSPNQHLSRVRLLPFWQHMRDLKASLANVKPQVNLRARVQPEDGTSHLTESQIPQTVQFQIFSQISTRPGKSAMQAL